MRLPALAIARPVGTCVVFGAVILVGLASLAGLPIDLLPDVSFPRLTIAADYPGAGPEEVENLVTRILEEAASTVPKVQDILSTSAQGTSRVTVVFPYGTDLDAAASDLRAAIERVRRRLPEDATTPVVFKFDPSQFPILQVGLLSARGARMDPVELRRMAEEQVLFRLERVPGVAVAEVVGGVQREIRVELDRGRMQALRISEQDVANALQATNLSQPVGTVREGPKELGLRVLSRYTDLEQIRNTPVAVRDGRVVYVRDVARVVRMAGDETGRVRINGEPGVLLVVRRQPGVNTVAVSEGVRRELLELGRLLPEVRFVVVGDSAELIRRSIRSVRDALLVGAALAVGVLLLFLRDPRSVLVIGTAIPTSLVATFALMYLSGYSLNLMTLGALALGVGMLVDSSIVVLENIFRLREQGASGTEAARSGAQQVAGAVTASTLTTVVVFLPVVVLRTGAVTTQMFVQFSYVVIFALLCSLLTSLALTPVLGSWLPAMRSSGGGWFGPVREGYRRLLALLLHRRWLVWAGCAAAAAVGIGSFRLLGSELIPQVDEGEIFVSIQFPQGTSLEAMDRQLRALEQTVRRVAPEVELLTVTSGTAAFGPGGASRGSLRLRLRPRSERPRTTEEVASALRRTLAVPGGRVVVRTSAGAFNIFRFGSTDPIAVEIRGYDLREGMRLGEQVRSLLERIPGITDATIAREEQAPELALRVDLEKAASLGLSAARIASALEAAVGGKTATLFREAGSEIGVVVRMREPDRRLARDVLALPITTPTGRQVQLGQVVTLIRDVGPAQITRRGRQRVVTVTAGLAGRDFGGAAEEVRAHLARLRLPPGFAVALSEEYEEQQRAYRQLAWGFALAVLLVYAVMAVQFERLLEPLLIMASVPFAVAGSFLLLALTGTTLNIQSLIGLIVLAGVVVNNAIVLMDFILQLHRDGGMPLYRAVVEAAGARLRPVLMTTLTTVLALIPSALGLGEGAELQAPLARSVIGGMVLSTLVTLFLIPSLYVAVEEARVRRRAAIPVPQPAAVAGGSDPPDEPGVPPAP
ncbi:MAG: efflux RND transporter permease subunit [Armatimonadota bacterium]|nr:efflux RND transporter permease subunit [Armatimonadota bacterium]MDR7444934.1 efflux RND transporter permease subunit [Armatimonadota bacterium]MDR7570834.1 efflux RND transporter permease subunit [Armatimonadota bacterium]MDR7615131.1 efflux RND transporter permease subunit [Armatimonadota bacterium]